MTTKAATAKDEPLVVPPAPPRVIAPIPEPDDQSVTESEPEPVPQLPRQTRTTPRENAPRTEPKPPQQDVPGPTEAEAKPPAPAPAPTTPAPELRTIDAADPALATKKVRDTMESAGRTLAQIDYGKLPKPSQLQYDMAKRFIEQSEEALKAKNFTAAQLMAEKAQTIARELSGR
ncbi:MAG: hypothetical protein ACM36C_05790 [Acidobacteriota bacterium]